ncbi:F-box-like protein [Ceratobasidium sp. AG-Ba]|nr:F-box-like protein [Ceratobasidium sp. AG-Ba]
MLQQSKQGDETGQKIARSHSALDPNIPISPSIAAFPPEILSQIFIFAAEPLSCESGFRPNDTPHPLLVIPAVCTGWRRLAFVTRSLWTHIAVGERRIPLSYLGCALSRISGWLNRADTSPLHLTFHENTRPAIVDEFREHIPYAVSLTFYRPQQECFGRILDMYAAANSTRLDNLVVHKPAPEPSQLPYVWPKDLVVLDLWYLPATALAVEQLIAVLLSSPRLEMLQISGSELRPIKGEEYPLIMLPRLRKFGLSPLNDQAFEQLLSIIAPGPRISQVQLRLPWRAIDYFGGMIQNFLRHSQISKFCLRGGYDESAPFFGPYFDLMPDLEDLYLSHLRSAAVYCFLDVLVTSVNGQVRPRCRKLRTIALLQATVSVEAWEKLKMVVGVYQLKKVMIYDWDRRMFDSKIQEDPLAWLKERVETVLEIDAMSDAFWSSEDRH